MLSRDGVLMGRVLVRDIQRVIASDFDVPAGTLCDPCKRKEFARPRQYAMLLARELTPLSFTSLGRLFARDHSTIVTGVRSAESRVAKDRNLALKLEARALLFQCEPQISVDARFIGFPAEKSDNPINGPQAIHNCTPRQLLAETAVREA
jgi:hypothetical protein